MKASAMKLSLTRRLQRCSLLLLVISMVFMGGCSSLKETVGLHSKTEDGLEKKTDLEQKASKLLKKGMDDYSVGKYFAALDFFEQIMDRYPFSTEAVLAELKAADCSYHMSRYQEALLLYEEFENRHPTNESIPYVMYQMAMCNYKQIDRVDRDPSGASNAVKLFTQLLQAYPDSPYRDDAETRISEATEFLANHEYFVVEYYIRSAKYDQAKVRLNYILAMYPDTRISVKARELLGRIEAGNPPKSTISSLFPKIDIPEWATFWAKDEENSSATPMER